MIMKPTVLVYSSHDRSDYLHREWIVQRALESFDNKSIFYIPFSMENYDQQEYSWGTFRYYFQQFAQYGLNANTFFWSDHLSKEDVDIFMTYLKYSEVVIFGGGNSRLGLERYRWLGHNYYGNADTVKDIIFDRQNRGKLTVGFSAGSDQLCEVLAYDYSDQAFGLAHKITATLHHEWGREGEVYNLAQTFPECLAFGLPNDAGIAVNQGNLPNGGVWQVIQFITDNSWDYPSDAHHIKTRQGMKIDHFYCDGRDWKFNGGDVLVRAIYPDNSQEGWIVQPNNPITYDYWSQQPTDRGKLDSIMHYIFHG